MKLIATERNLPGHMAPSPLQYAANRRNIPGYSRQEHAWDSTNYAPPLLDQASSSSFRLLI